LASAAKEKLLAAFDVAGNRLHEKSFSGCIFSKAVAEFSDSSSQVGFYVQSIKDYIENTFKI
jgi:hypothetical protein